MAGYLFLGEFKVAHYPSFLRVDHALHGPLYFSLYERE